MGLARWPLSRLPGLEFYKLCGSGVDQGFTPRMNPSVWAVLCVWRDEACAKQAMARRFPFTWYNAHVCESWTAFLRPVSARGAWSRRAPFDVSRPRDPGGAVVALTRATIRPAIAMQFWRQVPDISAVIGENTDVRLKIGLGEVPFFQQITFSVWPDAASMAQFARKPGPHAAAIQAVREGNWFSEELYARFEILEETGAWDGKTNIAGSAPSNETVP